MSRDDRDQRGGHAYGKSNTFSCGCCPREIRPQKSKNRRRRNRSLERHERLADGR